MPRKLVKYKPKGLGLWGAMTRLWSGGWTGKNYRKASLVSRSRRLKRRRRR